MATHQCNVVAALAAIARQKASKLDKASHVSDDKQWEQWIHGGPPLL